jgi:hypothetical protein
MIEKALRILISSNLWVGLAVASMALMSFAYPWDYRALLYASFLVFASTSAYSYMRWVKMISPSSSNQPLQVAGSDSPTGAFIYSLINAGLALFFGYYLYTYELLLALAPALLLAVLYPLAFPHPNRAFSSLRSIPMLKLFLISFCWAWMSFAIPMFIQGQVWDSFSSFELFFRSLLIAGLTIPFDVRDRLYDPVKMKTIPQIIGVDRALYWSGILILIYEIWCISAFFIWQIDWQLSLAWIIGLEIGAQLIKRVRHNPSELYIGFWIEAIPIIVFILACLSYLSWGNF